MPKNSLTESTLKKSGPFLSPNLFDKLVQITIVILLFKNGFFTTLICNEVARNDVALITAIQHFVLIDIPIQSNFTSLKNVVEHRNAVRDDFFHSTGANLLFKMVCLDLSPHSSVNTSDKHTAL